MGVFLVILQHGLLVAVAGAFGTLGARYLQDLSGEFNNQSVALPRMRWPVALVTLAGSGVVCATLYHLIQPGGTAGPFLLSAVLACTATTITWLALDRRFSIGRTELIILLIVASVVIPLLNSVTQWMGLGAFSLFLMLYTIQAAYLIVFPCAYGLRLMWNRLRDRFRRRPEKLQGSVSPRAAFDHEEQGYEDNILEFEYVDSSAPTDPSTSERPRRKPR